MWPAGMRVIQDPVHGLMRFARSEAFVVDLLRCSELQRLRRIKQLGFGCFVFPGAEHSRFSHAIGTAYLAARVGEHLSNISQDLLPLSVAPDPRSLQDFSVAALCHDLGHGPFSHVWERVVIGEDWNKRKWAKALPVVGADPLVFKRWHEMVTYAMLTSPEGQLNEILEGNESGSARRIAGIPLGDYYLPYMSRMVSSEIDVDRCDYLLRDAKMAGLPSCGFQLDRLIACLTFGFDQNGQCCIGLNQEKGLAVAIELLNARYELHQVLYFHKTILGMEWLLGNLLHRLRDLVSKEGLKLATKGLVPQVVLDMIAGNAVDIGGVMDLDDYTIWMLVAKIRELTNNDPTAVGLARRLMERDPLRAARVESSRIEDFFAADPRARDEMVEDVVSKYVEGKAHYFYRSHNSAFKLWEKDDEDKALLIPGDSMRLARKLSDHKELRKLFPYEDMALGTILLVPREAREKVEELVKQNTT